MKLSVIIVSYNVVSKLRENLQALTNSQIDFDMEILLVDNNSSDGSVEMVSQEFPQVKLIKNLDNLGFSKANNMATRVSQGQYVLLLNPDMKVERSTIQNMIIWMDQNPQATVGTCKLVDASGQTIQNIRRFPRLFDQLCIILKIPHIFPSVLYDYLCHEFDYAKDSQVDSVRGSFLIMRADNDRKLMLLDERYFIWFEEVDYCHQVKARGGQVWYTGQCVCLDYVGASFFQISREIKQRYFKNSMLSYFRKWHPGWQYWILKIAWFIMALPIMLSTFFGIKSRIKT